jgi:hypothetical protein
MTPNDMKDAEATLTVLMDELFALGHTAIVGRRSFAVVLTIGRRLIGGTESVKRAKSVVVCIARRGYSRNQVLSTRPHDLS